MISTRSVGLLIDTVVCLTLAKWETVSGRFGGYFIWRLFDAYGPQRCYWGTDITNGFDRATYRQRITHFTEELPFLSEEDKDWIMGRAIVARLDWSPA
jgi:hypothetical protein